MYHPGGTVVRMGEADVRKLIETISTITPGCRDRDRLAAAVASVARLRAWLDGRDAQLASQLAQVASFPT